MFLSSLPAVVAVSVVMAILLAVAIAFIVALLFVILKQRKQIQNSAANPPLRVTSQPNSPKSEEYTRA